MAQTLPVKMQSESMSVAAKDVVASCLKYLSMTDPNHSVQERSSSTEMGGVRLVTLEKVAKAGHIAASGLHDPSSGRQISARDLACADATGRNAGSPRGFATRQGPIDIGGTLPASDRVAMRVFDCPVVMVESFVGAVPR
jgi:hypothetical protein